ncbi:MAG: cob(I)yrinic acid a,c-diamide adenosyltransferase [Chloroflexia bacterium]|nr:cob(I)yrinic acid a,c-diamide adenosyltransferase [Chloroflexia bacterium]
MRIYTAKGDQGQTDLLGDRVGKDDPRIELLGALDETTSAIGLGRAQAVATGAGDTLLVAQRDLYQIMAELAFTDELRPDAYRLPEERVTWLEDEIARLTERVRLPPEFVVPGDTVGGAALDVARTVARRAERVAVVLTNAGQVRNPQVLRYLNRLSSLLFILARAEDAHIGEGPRLAKER